jgi:hypothetical protein
MTRGGAGIDNYDLEKEKIVITILCCNFDPMTQQVSDYKNDYRLL